MASIPKPIKDWISQFFTEKGVPESSSDVDHDQTTNRTHEGDDLSPATLEAGDSIGNARYATKDDVPTDLPEGTQVYVEDEKQLYIEDGA